MINLKTDFISLLGSYTKDLSKIESYWDELEVKYSASSRYYHDLSHIESMLNEMTMVSHLISDKDAFKFAIYYHDIIYKATKSDNEYQSALLFEKRISSTHYKAIAKVKEMILATKSHQTSDHSDINLLLDIDLSILGSDSHRYREYSKQIKKEFATYPNFLYRRGRKKVLKYFLELGTIFKTDHFYMKYEKQARINLMEELQMLG